MQCAVRASAPYSNSSIFMYTKHKYEYILHFEYSIYPPLLIVAFDSIFVALKQTPSDKIGITVRFPLILLQPTTNQSTRTVAQSIMHQDSMHSLMCKD
jgi:hypothetical protein